MITSTANAQVKELVRLMKKSRARDEAGVFLIEGPRMAGELTADPAWQGKIRKIYLSESYAKKNAAEAEGLKRAGLTEILADPANGPLRLAHGACKGCPELSVLGRTMKKRMRDILAFFDWDNNANGPTEAINGRLETLRGIALGFTNLGNYVTRSLLHAGGFRQAIQPHLR